MVDSFSQDVFSAWPSLNFFGNLPSMKKCLLIACSLFLFLIHTSCKKEVAASGRIVSAIDGTPLERSRVDWLGYYKMTTETDSLGRFVIGDTCLCLPDCPKLEVIVREKGFEPLYLDLTGKSNFTADNLLIKMVPLTGPPKVFKETTEESLLKSMNAFLSLVNIFTLVMICLSKVRHKALWIIAVLFLSFTYKYNYFNQDTVFYPFSFLVQIRLTYIGWYVFFIPVASILFWIHYFFKKRSGINLFAKASD
jgi:hypothetical protein